ncbi:hypothetical protein EHF36_10245 [Kerstersia gyiorum]|uniref:hypothetical protein n=1 Tax=Kerstersia gyiorum TaxID=206506 RepID=UPI001070BAC0|nr:hypothetical protein [Kerstersia gyiorum]QBR40964.1 hypothetical protein EHF36_10245 [Kerstersia gyiorum]
MSEHNDSLESMFRESIKAQIVLTEQLGKATAMLSNAMMEMARLADELVADRENMELESEIGDAHQTMDGQ